MEDYRPENLETPQDTPRHGAPSPWMILAVQLAMCFLLATAGALLASLVVGAGGWNESLLSGTLSENADPSERWQLRLVLTVAQLFTFLVAGWATVRVFYTRPHGALQYLRATRRPAWRLLLAGVLLLLVAAPLVLYLYQINQMLPLPESLRLLEDQAEGTLKELLKMDSPAEFAANLALIALLPALGEELVFRGVVQQQLLRVVRPVWAALLLTAAVFSFFHFQFEGFLPRLLLGLLLGWLYWRTQNFWVPVAAHFVNNGIQVFGQYLYHHDLSSIDLEQDVEVPWHLAALSLLLVWGLLRWIDRYAAPQPFSED